jgi:hypothetical protein
MKILLLLLFIAFTIGSPNWTRFIKRNIPISAKGYQAVPFDETALQIDFKVSCTDKCDIYLILEEEFNKLKESKPFKFIKADMKTKYSSNEFKDTDIISQGIFIVVVNPNDFVIKTSLYLRQQFEESLFYTLLFFTFLEIAILSCVIISGFICLLGIFNSIRDKMIMKQLHRPNHSIYPSLNQSGSNIEHVV